jgi:hypothetical protein
MSCQCCHHPRWGLIKDQRPLPDAMPGRFTSPVFVAEERLDAIQAGWRTCFTAVR